MDAVHGYHILEEQKFKMPHAKAHMDFINKSINEIEAELFLQSRQYDTQIKRIATVTGITELSALFILSEIGADIFVFESDRHLCSWAGFTPANNESASKKKAIIAIGLNTEFTGDTWKLVFWYDDNGEFAEDMKDIELENAGFII